jgi:hypothetical protein
MRSVECRDIWGGGNVRRGYGVVGSRIAADLASTSPIGLSWPDAIWIRLPPLLGVSDTALAGGEST